MSVGGWDEYYLVEWGCCEWTVAVGLEGLGGVLAGRAGRGAGGDRGKVGSVACGVTYLGAFPSLVEATGGARRVMDMRKEMDE